MRLLVIAEGFMDIDANKMARIIAYDMCEALDTKTPLRWVEREIYYKLRQRIPALKLEAISKAIPENQIVGFIIGKLDVFNQWLRIYDHFFSPASSYKTRDPGGWDEAYEAASHAADLDAMMSS